MAGAPTLGRVACFDRIARLYRPMEYLSFGLLLERCRFFHLPCLAAARHALVIGDGDGRFLARLLAANRQLCADAVDASPAMLRLLAARTAGCIGVRLNMFCTDARAFTPPAGDYDLVVTHFFLDCLTHAEAASLIDRMRPHLAPGALWLVSEFQVPATGRFAPAFARMLIAGLYAAFRLLTGLRVRQIPSWRKLLATAGFNRKATHSWLAGMLVSELWEYQATASAPPQSHDAMSDLAIHLGNIPGIDPGPMPSPDPPAVPEPEPAPGPAPEPDPEPYPGPIPAPQPVT